MPDARRPRKVNDIYTADLSFRLARELDASFLVNETVDRNELDLNRISQIVRRAPWFLDVIEHLIGRILDRHGTAVILFVHGWNVTQARCDIGIGASIADEDALVEGNETVTVSHSFLQEKLRLLRHLCDEVGIRSTYGERYPASHPNNVVQIFRRTTLSREPAKTFGRLSDWVAARRIEAVQLELGVAVRWPGATRNAFVAALTKTFTDAPRASLPAPVRRDSRRPRRLPASLQCFDPVSEIGVSAGVAAEPGGVIRGRLLLFLGGQRVALFVGEDRGSDRLVSGGPEFHSREGGFRVSFEGAILCVDDGRLYLDLEDAFAASTLHEARLELDFDAFDEARYGKVHGNVRLNGRVWPFDCYGFADGFVRPNTPMRPTHTSFSASFGADLGLQVRTGGRQDGTCGTITRIASGERRSEALRVLSVTLDADGYTPRRITVPLGGTEIVAEPVNRVSIYRPGTVRRPARVTFGVARVEADERSGFGFYEYARPARP